MRATEDCTFGDVIHTLVVHINLIELIQLLYTKNEFILEISILLLVIAV